MDDEAAATERLRAALDRPDEAVDLAAAALLLAELSGDHPDAHGSIQILDELGTGLRSRLGAAPLLDSAADALARYLGYTVGFRGNEDDYYDPANSYLDIVLRRRIGLPITLSVVYIDVGRRAGLDVRGIGFPGHFIVGVYASDSVRYLDPFRRGLALARSDLEAQLHRIYGRAMPLRRAMVQPATSGDIIVRMLRNLKHAYLRRNDTQQALRATSRLRALQPDDVGELCDHAVLLVQRGQWQAAKQELSTFLQVRPQGADVPSVRELLAMVETVRRTMN